MKAYDALHTFPEVGPALEAVARSGMDAYIFSNGTDDMVRASVMTSPDLQPHSGMFKGFITVEELQSFKPTRKVYDDLLRKVAAEKAENIWVISANPFDVVGTRAAGLHAAWIDRAGTGWVDRLGDVIGGIEPTLVVSGVDKAVEAIIERS